MGIREVTRDVTKEEVVERIDVCDFCGAEQSWGQWWFHPHGWWVAQRGGDPVYAPYKTICPDCWAKCEAALQ